MMKENSLIKISVDTLGSETSIANIVKGLNNSFLPINLIFKPE